MAETKIKTLPEREAIKQIVKTVKWAKPGEAPFALVLGSGFSHGLVPVARELIAESLPLWMKSLETGESYEQLQQISRDEREKIATSFWQEFFNQNAGRDGFDVALNARTNLPENYAEAYRAAFNPDFDGAVNSPKNARDFQRALMQLNKPRLNAAHFLLASLLGVQPGKTIRSKSLFKTKAAFSRLILTTNFDPFLQTALQAVNQLYFMSDTPKLGVSDEIYDDQTEAIHLVYLHGSVHRRDQAATQDDIDEIKRRNAQMLGPVLERHGVIVLGYSGWDDAIVEALAGCSRFDHRLYWCGREPNSEVPGAFGKRVPDILRKPAAYYVQIAGAGSFMAQLCTELVNGLPRLLDNPIGQLRDLLDMIDLKELEEVRPEGASDLNTPQLISGGDVAKAFIEKKQSTIERLLEAENVFLGRGSSPPVTDKAIDQPLPIGASVGGRAANDAPVESRGMIQQLLSSAQLALGLGNYDECLKLCNEGLGFTALETRDRARFLLLRARAHDFSKNFSGAIKDWSETIDLPGASAADVSQALFSRAFKWGEQGETEKEMADYTRVIEEVEGAPVEQVASALFNRGFRWGEEGETEKAISDYTRVIEELEGAPVEVVARALVNRGFRRGKQGETEKAISDYTRVIEELEGAPVEQVSRALFNRGFLWGEEGETDKEIADYTRVIEEVEGAPVDQVAKALNNRGFSWGKQGETEKEIADYTRVIEEVEGAPVGLVAKALINRGVTLGKKGEKEKAMADYTRVIEELEGAPAEEVAEALTNRGWQKYENNDFLAFLADTEAASKNHQTLNLAAFNLGLALLANRRDANALEAYRAAGARFPETIDGALVDILQATEKWLPEERAVPVIRLLESLKNKP